MISLDTLRADRLGSYGYRAHPTTPSLDELASEGALFEVHVAASPWTTPSNLSLFTSLTPTEHGVTFPLSELAAATARGREIPALSPHYDTLTTHLKRAGYRTAAFTGGGAMAPELGFGRGFDRYETDMVKIGDSAMTEMLGWISEDDHRPFFLFWHTYEIHAPYVDARFLPPDDHPDSEALRTELDDLRRELMELPGGLEERRSATLRAVELLRSHDLWRPDVIEALYDGSIASADRWVGRLLDFLREKDLESETIVVVTSDHGEEFDEHTGLFYDAHGHTVYEELIRVPLLIRYPGTIAAGLRIGGQTRSIDLFPTLLDLLRLPWRSEQIEGRSLAARLRRDPEVDPSRPALAVSEALARQQEAKSIRTDEYKYIVWIAPDHVVASGRGSIPRRPTRRELYHLKTDPGETRNLLTTSEPLPPEARSALKKLDSRLSNRPGATFTPETETLTREDLERLRALGYLDGQ